MKKTTLTDAILSDEINDKLFPLIKQAELLSKKYDVLVTNPPYMGIRGMNKKLSDFLKTNFKGSKSDFFSAFVEKSFSFCKSTGYLGFLTPYVWMFISSYGDLRENIMKNKTITSLIQFEYSAFEEATVPICTFTLKNTHENIFGKYIKLSDFRGGMEVQEAKTLEAITNLDCDYLFCFNQLNFKNIPGNPIAFWAGPQLINAFKNGKKLSELADIKQGLATGDNKKFIRFWHEVDINKIGFDYNPENAKQSIEKWFPYNKGGKYRKWYGNNEFIVDYEDNGKNILDYKQKKLKKGLIEKKNSGCWNSNFYFRESLSWSKISSGNIAFRFFQNGFLFDVAGCSIFTEEDKLYLLGFLNSQVCGNILGLISPTLNYEVGHISSLPIIFSEDKLQTIKGIVKKNIDLSKDEWDNFETSWNFKKHPIIQTDKKLISEAYEDWDEISKTNFYNLMENEKQLNQIFFEIYDLRNDSYPEIDESNIALRKADLERDIKSFLSYFLGCLMGRYSLNDEGVIFSGGEYNPSKYSKFIPDEDNIVPILDTEYFEDDIIKQFTEFLKVTFSEETLEENIKFIANALGNKGKTYRETIRKYFLTDFYKDHVKTYKKTPIYWLFDSGKENGFKALIYLHRYTPDTVARIRTDYLHKTQKAIETSIANNEQIILNSTNQKEKNQATKDNTKLKKQLDETIKYDEALAHIANKQIELDLDDGVKVNYAKFQGVEVGNKKIDLLKKI
ncbi:MAG: BREX-1 system adenine-specific DNA-methyltransferase PglX [Methanobrevibacter sp.]|nr:BREX-1 system adenine-specific DNA-methyltransferase PglX [Methanobrevibacter sp.]